MEKKLLTIRNLIKSFPIRGGLMRRVTGRIKAVEDISFDVFEDEIFGLVGESGSGKTTIAKVTTGMYRPTSGEVIYKGKDIGKLPKKELSFLRREIQMVFQDPRSSLNPRRSVLSSLEDPLIIHKIGKTQFERRKIIGDLLERVEMPKSYMYKYPASLSGGQRQRVALARALAVNPTLFLLDEPTSALDVAVQTKIINLLQKLRKEMTLSYIFITHDLCLIRTIADRIAVMYLGKIFEMGSAVEMFRNPLHPYTNTLLSAVPVVSKEEEELKPKSQGKEGEPPSPVNPPPGCPFHPRCGVEGEGCSEKIPPLIEIREGYWVRCHKYSQTESEKKNKKGAVK